MGSEGSLALDRRSRNKSVYCGFDPAGLVQDGHTLSNVQGVRKNVDAVSVVIGGTRNLHCGNSSAEGAGRPEGLGRSSLAASIQDESGWYETDEFVASGAKLAQEEVIGQIQHTSEFTAERKDEVGVSRSTL